ncbi:MAG: hypothetical protein M3063_03930 [Actinomycetota bacterium]|nr:hypothetical protein [Actinomycetota bacterium]
MAAPTTQAAPSDDANRAAITQRTLRRDRWWVQPTVSGAVLLAFIVYSTYAAFQNADYFYKPYISPFYSPCLVDTCNVARAGSQHVSVPHLGIFGTWWSISPAILILIFPLGFRMTCYYYRKAYYRAFLMSPPGCAVAEPRKTYTGETRFPLILQNIHRYFFYFGLIFNVILTYDAVVSFRNHNDQWGHVGVGTAVLCVNAILLWAYTLSCHSCRHIIGGRLKHFSKHPIRFKLWGVVTKLNTRHMQLAWCSLIFVGLTDLYIRLVSSGTIHGGWV